VNLKKIKKFKKVLVYTPALIFFIISSYCNSQNLLDLPESIIYDSSHYRYLISNYGTGDIIQIDSTGEQRPFVSNANAIQGLEITGNVVYVGAGQMVRGFDLETGQMVMDVHVNDVSNLNDVTADTSGNLYVSDVYGTKIIKIIISTGVYSVFVNGNGIIQPNGIYFDKPNNRLLVCSFRANSPIQAVNISDSTVSTIVNTNISLCDGITKDRYGNCYVTSWTNRSIYKYDSLFSGVPVMIYSNTCGPADISYDNYHDVIAVPLQLCNSWTAFSVTIGIKKIGENIPAYFSLGQNYPNPFNPATNITFSISKGSYVKLIIYDTRGRELTQLVSEFLPAGNYSASWNALAFANGVYYYRLVTEDYSSTRKMVLIK
jgi:hypothetical protein